MSTTTQSTSSNSPPKRKLSGTTTITDVFFNTALPAAKKYLFLPVDQKALFYLVSVTLLSIFASYYPPSEGYYLASKGNALNRYGTKIGWFWTIITVGPYIWLTSYLHHKNHPEAMKHLSRLLIATGMWYFVTATFIHVEKITSRCVDHQTGSPSNLDECSLAGGKWAPGIDISGHAFMLIYMCLVISEEAKSFMYWPNTPKRNLRIASVQECNEFKMYTNCVQALFLILFFFHIFWDFQLLITCLFYHNASHKLIASGTAIACWAISYRFWYPMAFPGEPIQRKMKSF
jgi:hypothetical protein